MIVLDLLGGLGNQLFVWAAGRALEMNGQEVSYCTCRLEADKGRRYLLGDLGLLLRFTDKHPSRHFNAGIGYCPEIFSLTGDWTLMGYFQSEKYWSDEVRSSIVDSLWPVVFFEPSDSTYAMAIRISRPYPKCCFVHVRRSDNLSPRGLSFHGLTSDSRSFYYDRAMAKMPADTHFFVFSDDPAWCKTVFINSNQTVVDCNAPSFTVDGKFELTKNDQGTEVQDLWLMSLCKHAIIANSSFSWWGAWLGERMYLKEQDDRIVIAPDPWFADPKADSSDIVPARWLKVKIK
jgi:hypothetical protein